MNALAFTATFETQVTPASGTGREGIDVAIHKHEPIGGDRIKGLMRADAARMLQLPADVLDPVFGTASSDSPWSWTTDEIGTTWSEHIRHRVAIDPETDAVELGNIASAQTTWAKAWRFSVEQRAWIEPTDVTWHQLVLRASASSVKHLGLWRRRGYGWLGIAPDEPVVRAEELDQLLTWRSA